jgi:hypothetical protein
MRKKAKQADSTPGPGLNPETPEKKASFRQEDFNSWISSLTEYDVKMLSMMLFEYFRGEKIPIMDEIGRASCRERV